LSESRCFALKHPSIWRLRVKMRPVWAQPFHVEHSNRWERSVSRETFKREQQQCRLIRAPPGPPLNGETQQLPGILTVQSRSTWNRANDCEKSVSRETLSCKALPNLMSAPPVYPLKPITRETRGSRRIFNCSISFHVERALQILECVRSRLRSVSRETHKHEYCPVSFHVKRA
jgi:hypothetical protein